MTHTTVQNTDATGPRGSRPIRGLLVLNVALLIVLGAVTFGASVQGQARGRGEYTMVAADVQGVDASVVFIADVANQEMLALAYDPNTQTLDGVGYRNLAADAAAVQRGRNATRN